MKECAGGIMIGMVIGGLVVGLMAFHGIENNTIDGYHCAEVTHHKTMKSAKEQVLLNQAHKLVETLRSE